MFGGRHGPAPGGALPGLGTYLDPCGDHPADAVAAGRLEEVVEDLQPEGNTAGTSPPRSVAEGVDGKGRPGRCCRTTCQRAGLLRS
jgi:hypothetical protein